MSEYLGVFWQWVFSLNRQDWLLVMVAGCLVGFFCMRGLGSRSQF